MTLRFWTALVLMLVFVTPVMAADKTGIAVIVNDEPITVADVNDRVALYTSSAPTPPPDDIRAQIAHQVLGKLIDEKLQVQEAAKSGIVVSEAQVQEAFATVAQNNNSTADEFKARMLARGVKPQTLIDQLRAEIAWGQLARRKLRPQINITESEIDAEFDKMANAPAPVQPPAAPTDAAIAPADPSISQAGPVAPPAPNKTDEAQREQVANNLGMDRMNKLADRYLRDLRATAFIDKRN